MGKAPAVAIHTRGDGTRSDASVGEQCKGADGEFCALGYPTRPLAYMHVAGENASSCTQNATSVFSGPRCRDFFVWAELRFALGHRASGT